MMRNNLAWKITPEVQLSFGFNQIKPWGFIIMNKWCSTCVKGKKKEDEKDIKFMPILKNTSDVLVWRKCSYIIKAGKQFDLLSWFLFAISVAFLGISGHSFPEGYRLSFPTRTNYMYAVVTHSIPKLRAFTLCLWLRPAERGIGTPVSYAVPEQPNELVLLQGLHTPAELLINDKVLRVSESGVNVYFTASLQSPLFGCSGFSLQLIGHISNDLMIGILQASLTQSQTLVFTWLCPFD